MLVKDVARGVVPLRSFKLNIAQRMRINKGYFGLNVFEKKMFDFFVCVFLS